MAQLIRPVALLDQISFQLGRGVQWLAVAMVAVTLVIVILRYVFSIGAIPLQESVIYMHGLLFLLGIPYGIRANTHVRVDLLYSRLSVKNQQMVDLCGHCLFLVPISLFIIIQSYPYAVASWRVLEGSPEVGGIPAIFLLKSLIPLTGALMCSQAVVEIVKIVQRLRAA